VNDHTDTSFFSDNFLNTTPVPEAFETLRELVDRRFGDNVHLVSKCGRRTQEKTLQWLEHHNFYQRTGINPAHVHFCRERREKAGICARLGATHFIDDRLEILSYLTSVPNLYLFQADAREVNRFRHVLPSVTRVESWAEILQREMPATQRT
jgi:hypothetical protein